MGRAERRRAERKSKPPEPWSFDWEGEEWTAVSTGPDLLMWNRRAKGTKKADADTAKTVSQMMNVPLTDPVDAAVLKEWISGQSRFQNYKKEWSSPGMILGVTVDLLRLQYTFFTRGTVDGWVLSIGKTKTVNNVGGLMDVLVIGDSTFRYALAEMQTNTDPSEFKSWKSKD